MAGVPAQGRQEDRRFSDRSHQARGGGKAPVGLKQAAYLLLRSAGFISFGCRRRAGKKPLAESGSRISRGPLLGGGYARFKCSRFRRVGLPQFRYLAVNSLGLEPAWLHISVQVPNSSLPQLRAASIAFATWFSGAEAENRRPKPSTGPALRFKRLDGRREGRRGRAIVPLCGLCALTLIG